MSNTEGTMAASIEALPVFVDYWVNDLGKSYTSPYGTTGRRLAEGNSKHR